MFENEQLVISVVGGLALVLYLVGISLHGLGIFIVLRAKKLMPNQRLYLINFSLSELGMMFVQSAYAVGHISQYRPIQVASAFLQCVLAICWASSMILMTVDRLLEIKLNIKYPLYVTTPRVKFCLAAIWCLAFTGIAVLFTVNLVFHVQEDLMLSFIYKAIFPAFELLFLITCTSVYVYIFKKIKQTRSIPYERNGNRLNSQPQRMRSLAPRSSVTERRKIKKEKEIKAKNFLPFYIIVTFIFFAGIPELVTTVLVYVIKIRQGKRLLFVTCLFAYVIGYIIDAILYMFMLSQLKSILYRTLKLKRIGTEESTVKYERTSEVPTETTLKEN